MSIAFECPACGSRISAPDGAMGKIANCGCGASVRVPAAVPRVFEGVPVREDRDLERRTIACELCGQQHPGPEKICEGCRESFGASRCTMCGAMSGGAGNLCASCRASLGRSPSGRAGVSGAPSATPQACGMATASLIFGVVGLCCVGIAAIPAVVLGHQAKAKIQASGGALTGEGAAVAGLVLGYLTIALWGVIIVLYIL